jgi:hypothetical protein
MSQLYAWWQAMVKVGMPIFPYLGLALLIIFAIAVFVALCYILYRLLLRIPPIIRYLLWRASTILRMLPRRTVRAAVPAYQLSARWAHARHRLELERLFPASLRWFGGTSRPRLPLVVVLGPAGAGTSSLLKQASGTAGRSLDPDGAETADSVWWTFNNRQAVELHPRLLAESEQPRFAQFLAQLQSWNPAQPLNALVVVLPVALLTGSGDDARRQLDELSIAVRALCETAQSALPLQVVLSGAEHLRGFEAFTQTAHFLSSERQLHCMPPGAVGHADIDAALSFWCASLQNHAMRSVVTAPLTRLNADLYGLISFATALGALRLPLVEWIESATAQHERDQKLPEFEGLLLTGTLAAPDRARPAAWWGLGEDSRDLAFVRTRVSQVAPRFAAQMRREVGLAALALVSSLALLGLWVPISAESLHKSSQTMQEVIGQNANDRRSDAVPYDPGRIERIFKSIHALDQTSLWSVLAPSSWGDESRTQLLAQLGSVTHKLLIEPSLRKLYEDSKPELPAPDAELVLSVNASQSKHLPAYLELDMFLSQREIVGSAMKAAEKLSSGLTYLELMRLLDDDPARIQRPTWDWSAPLPRAVTQQFSPHQQKRLSGEGEAVASMVSALWERLLAESLDLNPVSVQAEGVTSMLVKLSQGADWTYDDTVALSQALRQLQREMDQPQAQRLTGKTAEGLRFIEPALTRLMSSSVVPLAQGSSLSNEFVKRREAVRNRLMGLEADAIGRIFSLDSATEKLTLSAEIKRFAVALGSFRSMHFMLPVSPVTQELESGQLLSWNLPQLESVKDLNNAFREFNAGGGQMFEPSLRPPMLRVARQQYRLHVQSQFMKAALPVAAKPGYSDLQDSAAALRAQIENLAGALRVHKLIMGIDDGASSGVAGDLLQGQVLRVLTALDKQLVREDPYASLGADTLRWLTSGASSRPLAAFMRGSPKERLSATREQIRVQYAVPVANLLASMDSLPAGAQRQEVVQRWRRLTETLDSFDKGDAVNALFELEQYLLNLSKLAAADDCAQYLNERAPVALRANYFSSRLAKLDEKLVESCLQRRMDMKKRGYQNFVQWFNTQISGHAPFHDSRTLTPLSRRSFVMLMKTYRSMRLQLGEAPPDDWPQPVLQFLSQMDSLLLRFAAPTSPDMKAMERPAQMSVQAKLQFRSQQAESVLTDQIINWSVQAGTRLYGLRNPRDAFEWNIGEPIELRLRWAANSAFAPTASPEKMDRYTVSERTAVFRFNGDWALFDLMRRHAARGDAYEQVVLRFDVDVVGPDKRSTAQAFLTLYAVDPDTPLALDFPSRAPQLLGPGESPNALLFSSEIKR